MMRYDYVAYMEKDNGIIRVNGTIHSADKDSAKKNLESNGLRVIEIREFSLIDERIERYKKLRRRLGG